MDYEKDRLKDCLRQYVEGITHKGKGGLYNCPLCGSGTGRKGTAAFSLQKDGRRWHCFSCGAGGDLFDLIGLHEGITEPAGQFARARELFGGVAETAATTTRKAPERHQEDQEPPKKADFSAYVTAAMEALHSAAGAPGREYLTGRGLSMETIRAARLGYDTKLQAVVIPYDAGGSYYITRAIQEKAYRKPPAGEAGPEPLFHGEALESGRPVFVVEGQIDALSVNEAGGLAVAIGGSGYRKIIEAVKDQQRAPLIVALDNDEPGQRTAATLCGELDKIGAAYIVAEITGAEKDANEALQRDRAAFTAAVQAAEDRAAHIEEAKAQAERDAYIKQASAGAHLPEFMQGIKDSVNTPVYSTGFPALDRELDGGLYEGLYILGAISSLGKTTLVLQMADNLAADGRDVLIISLEMARAELMAKSISRETLIYCQEANLDTRNAKTTRGITTYSRWEKYNREEIDTIQEAMRAYSKYAGRLFILEGLGNMSAADVRKAVDDHRRITGRAPVVVVDYLQLLAPENDRLTDKQATDRAVLALKQISRDYKIPVVAISSLNRSSYTGPVTMAAFKESGAIEYSSDVLIGLQLKGAGTDEEMDQAKQKDPREIELKILKNRNGKTGQKVGFEYYPLFNFFKETGAERSEPQATTRRRR